MKNQIHTYIYIIVYMIFIRVFKKKKESIADADILLYMVSF